MFILNSANRSDDEEVRQAILDDSAAFGIGCTIITLIQLVVGIGAVDLLNWAAVRQVNNFVYYNNLCSIFSSMYSCINYGFVKLIFIPIMTVNAITKLIII